MRRLCHWPNRGTRGFRTSSPARRTGRRRRPFLRSSKVPRAALRGTIFRIVRWLATCWGLAPPAANALVTTFAPPDGLHQLHLPRLRGDLLPDFLYDARPPADAGLRRRQLYLLWLVG